MEMMREKLNGVSVVGVTVGTAMTGAAVSVPGVILGTSDDAIVVGACQRVE